MTRFVFFLSVLSVLITSCEQQKVNIKKPNIILILTDDQGWGDLSLNGNPYLSTPNLDQLAQQGASFDRFYVSAVCSPTRAEILTGRYAVRGGVYSTSAGGERLDLDEGTIADLLKANGYRTGAFGKWHNGMQYPYHPNGRGFDEFYGYCSGHWGNYFSPMLERNGQLVKGEGFLTDDLTGKALDFIETNKNEPFFAYLPLNTPHSPMQVPDQWWNKFKDMEFAEHRYSDKENINKTRAAYAMCENIDWNVGRVMNKLKELEIEENTILVFLSDNGPNGWRWNDGMKGIKGHVDEGGVRSPMIISWPGQIDAGRNIEQIASSLDLLPTLAELSGIPLNVNVNYDGLSLKPVLLDTSFDWTDRMLVNHWRGQTSVRNPSFRLDSNDQLFHMIDDPGQLQDVSQQYPVIHQSMIDYKNKWEKDVLAELPKEDLRTFTVGHRDYPYYQLPARDAIASGQIQRSNRWPNCSFYTNWVNAEDSISWEIEVLEEGSFEAVVYYTCSDQNAGSAVELSFGTESVQGKIADAHDPPLTGMENDRIQREESYVKDFKPLSLGTIKLNQGIGNLTLKATEMAGQEVMDFRLLMLNRTD